MWKYVSAKLLSFCFAACGFATGLFLYADFRGSQFGFDLKGLVIGLCVTCLVSTLVVLPFLLLVGALAAMEEGTGWRHKWRKNRLFLFALLVGVFEGTLCAECLLTLDERAFRTEVLHHRSEYERDRRLIGEGSLWFSRKDGFSASHYSVATLKE